MRLEVTATSVFRRLFLSMLLVALVPLTVVSLYLGGKLASVGGAGVSLGTLLPFYLGTVVVVAWAAYWLARRLTRPIKALERGALEIARGRFEYRIPSDSDDEIGRLARLFNYMAVELRRLNDLNISKIITERNKTQAILRNLADGVIVTDLHGNVLALSSVAEQWLGVGENEAIGRPLRELWPNKTLLQLIQTVARNPGSGTRKAEVTTQSGSDWRLRVFECKAAPVFTGDNSPIGVVTVLRDVTREREVDRLKTELVSMVAHELRSPLTTIRGFAELLRDPSLDAEQVQEFANIIHEETSRLGELVNKFLDITRIESGKVQPNKTVVNLAEVVTTVLGNYAALAQEKDIRVEWEHPDEPVPVHADREMMTQLVLNLYSNAVKYSPPGRVVTVRLGQRGKEVYLEVEDQGYGIPKKDLPHIFDKFYRASNVAEQDSGPRGSGLGLALVHHIVRMHGGRITVSSEVGKGTRFRVTLPALRDERKKRSQVGQEDVESWRGATETMDG